MIAPTPAPSTAHATSLRAVWPAILGLSIVFLTEMLDNSVLNVALPTITRELGATASDLQWITTAYSLLFGGLMLVFGTIADRYGRRRIMLIGLTLFAVASLAVILVRTPGELTAVRAVIGIAAAMTAPGSMALSFRLFDDDTLRVRATALISTVGLTGLAIGPTVGGLILAVWPWQALLVINVPIAILAACCIRFGIRADHPAELHRAPLDLIGAARASGDARQRWSVGGAAHPEEGRRVPARHHPRIAQPGAGPAGIPRDDRHRRLPRRARRPGRPPGTRRRVAGPTRTPSSSSSGTNGRSHTRESEDAARLSPSTHTCPAGTVHVAR